MICPICKIRNLKSCVYPQGSSRTMAYYRPFFNEDGVEHHHDANSTSTSYRCSNGHVWVTHKRGRCPTNDCEWNNAKETLQVNKDLFSKEDLEELKQYLNSINIELF